MLGNFLINRHRLAKSLRCDSPFSYGAGAARALIHRKGEAVRREEDIGWSQQAKPKVESQADGVGGSRQ